MISRTLAIASLISAISLVGCAVPFVEGDWRFTNGSKYGFVIGSSKQDVVAELKRNYSKNDYYLRVIWPITAIHANELNGYENTDFRNYPNRKFSEYKIPISELRGIEPPLFYEDRWDIELPSSWVNIIYLKFKDGKLIEIHRSRWLYERP